MADRGPGLGSSCSPTGVVYSEPDAYSEIKGLNQDAGGAVFGSASFPLPLVVTT
jgi:hypothetical protein